MLGLNKGKMTAEQRAEVDRRNADAAMLSRGASLSRAQRLELEKRQSALEAIAEGKSFLLRSVCQVGAGMAILSMMSALCLLAVFTAAMAPVAGLVLAPVCILIPWMLYRGELRHLAKAAKDYPELLPRGKLGIPGHWTYRPACALVVLIVVGELALIGYWTALWVLSLFK
jgi:hypothetical protein